jgi:dihydropteroate synthase
MKRRTLSWGRHRLELGGRTCVMGILNVTPDSFSDGGRFLDPDRAVAHGLALVGQGADILDVGGESTRPYSEGISAEEEIRRVVPVIEALAAQVPVPISIDTTKAAVAQAAVAAGAALINDIGALGQDAGLGAVAAEHDLPVVLMHMRGTPRTMQRAPHYADLLGEIREFLAAAMERAASHGIDRQRLIIDPGIGFGKSAAHNLELLRRLPELATLNAPLLVGPSRKAFIRHLLRPAQGDEPPADSPQVATGTQAAVAAAVLNGADIVRVHDVAATRATLAIIDAVKFLPTAA